MPYILLFIAIIWYLYLWKVDAKDISGTEHSSAYTATSVVLMLWILFLFTLVGYLRQDDTIEAYKSNYEINSANIWKKVVQAYENCKDEVGYSDIKIRECLLENESSYFDKELYFPDYDIGTGF